MIVNRQTPSSPALPSFGLRSGNAETVRLVPARRAHPMPIASTCGHPRQASARLRPETDRAAQGLAGIRRRSSIVDHAKAAFVAKQFAAVGKYDDMPSAVGRGDVVLDRPADCGPATNLGLLRCNAWKSREGWRAAKFNAGTSFQGLHLSLHQRAGSPFRCSEYRATGPIMSIGTYPYFGAAP